MGEVKDDLSNLKEMVIDAFQEWMIATIVKKAVAKIVLLFNPAGAIIQAILAIVAIVQFVVQKAMQILDFVEAVVNSIYEIATGAVGSAVKKIEGALAQAIPLLIGFLASLLGLGGVSEKIKEFILKVQTKVDKAIDKVIAKVVGAVKKLVGGGEGKRAKLRGARWKAHRCSFKKPFNMGPASHTVTAELHGGQLKITMRSAESELIHALGKAIDTVSNDTKREKSQRKAILGHLKPALSIAKSLRQEWTPRERAIRGAAIRRLHTRNSWRSGSFKSSAVWRSWRNTTSQTSSIS